MKKVLLIGWKDVLLAFRDRAALILMLAAPFVLTLGLGLVAGRFSGSAGGISAVPVVLVNSDGQELGDALVELFRSPQLTTLLLPTVMADPTQARAEVDADRAAASVVIPAGFTASIIPSASGSTGQAVQVVLYSNPARPTGAGIVRTVLDGFLSQLEVGRVGGTVAVTQLINAGLIGVGDAARVGAEIGARQAQTEDQAIRVRNVTGSGEEVRFDILAYMAPGMALLFLMFTASNGGRTLWTERLQGTLPRLLVSPTSTLQVLAGKVLGIYWTGLAQVAILILASTLLFRLDWGDPLGVAVFLLVAVFGAVGWGLLIAAVARSAGQVSALGSAVMLTFGILGGGFVSLSNMPPWFVAISKITPNAWGLDGFNTLAMGGRLGDIVTPVVALLAMGALLFALAALLMNRRGIAQA